MEILIANSEHAHLLTNKSQPFLIVYLIGNFFILTKAPLRAPVDKNINFEYDGNSYYSTFIRHVNLGYAGKLS